jgi:hypothetical protein
MTTLTVHRNVKAGFWVFCCYCQEHWSKGFKYIILKVEAEKINKHFRV